MPFVHGKPSSASPWNKGLRGAQVAWNKGLTKEDGRVAKYARPGHPNYNIGLKGCFEKGRISPRKGIGKARYWNATEYHELRKHMYESHNYTCDSCGIRGGRLTLHHIFPVALFPTLVFAEENVMVLCVSCHRLTDTWGSRLVRKRGEFKERLSEITLSQAREETLLKVQRLAAEANAQAMPVIAATSAPLEREEIV